MLEVICNKAKTCKIEKCGMKKPHWHFGCKPCNFDDTAKCVNIKTLKKKEQSMKVQEISSIAIIVTSNSSGKVRKTFAVGLSEVAHIIHEPKELSIHGIFIEIEYKDEIRRVYGEVVDVSWTITDKKMEDL